MTDVATPLRVLQTDFRAGELDPRLYMRSDSKAYISGCRSLKNMIIRNTGAAERRPGTLSILALSGASRIEAFEFDENEKYVLCFQNNGLQIIDTSDGSVAATLSGSTNCPWTTSNMFDLQVAQAGNTAFIVHRDFIPKVLTRTGASSFSMASFAFDTDREGRRLEPYYRFEDDDVSITVTGTGTIGDNESVTLTASSGIFSSSWVGVWLQINDSVSVEITGYTNTTNVSATFRSDWKLFLDPNPLRSITGTTQFRITHFQHGLANGDTVTIAGATDLGGVSASNINGTRAITLIDDNTYQCTAGASFTANADGGGSAVTIEPNSGASTVAWKESAISALRGYPGAVVIHEDRLWFGGTDALPDALFSSRTGAYYKFDVDEGQATRSIQTFIGSTLIPNIKNLVSNRQLQIFTEGGEYVARQTEGAGLTPGNISIQPQTPYGSSGVTPKVFDGATIFINAVSSTARELVYDIQREGYIAPDITTLSNHLFTSPVDFDVLYGSTSRPEQYAFFVNSDGTLAVFHSIREEGLAAWVPWETRSGDLFKSVAVVGSEVYFVVYRNSSRYYLEKLALDSDVTLDAAVEKTGSSATVWDLDASPTYTNDPWGSQEVKVRSGDYYLGAFTATAGSSITLNDAVTSIQAGFDYEIEIIPMMPDIALGTGPMSGSRRRISAAVIHMYETLSMTVNGKAVVTLEAGFDVSNPPTRLTRKQKFFLQGWNRDPYLTITQGEPLPLTILGLVSEVSI